MNAKDIVGRKFEKSFTGYKAEDVDEFLKEVSSDYSALQKENRDLEKKLEVLADKIREYRNDEDVIKEALLGAQRQGNLAITEAKEKAAKIIKDAEEKSTKLLSDTDETDKKTREECKNLLIDSKEKAEKIVADANEAAEKIDYEMNVKTEIQKEILFRIKTEVEEYRQKLIQGYKKHIDTIEAFPKQCETEYANKTFDEYKKVRNVTLKKQPAFIEKENPTVKIKPIRIDEPPQEIQNNTKNEKQDTPKDINNKSVSFEIAIGDEVKDSIDMSFKPEMKNSSFPDDIDDNDKETTIKNSTEEKSVENKNKFENVNNFDSNLFFKKNNTVKNDNKLEFGNNSKVIKKK